VDILRDIKMRIHDSELSLIFIRARVGPVHHKVAGDFFKTLYDKNIFTEKVTGRILRRKCKRFLSDRLIVGTCPNCKNENAYGDQC